jgi:NAD(P)-dependent dehydrogenase (short-subunit alcohol dehydrogenase family)
MAGKTCLVTGATSGIGEVTAIELAELGASVILVGRSPTRLQATAERIHKRAPGVLVETIQADLTRQAEVLRVAAEVKGRHRKLDVLVNNAGAAYPTRRESGDGIELTWALNHMAYFLLTRELLELLKASAPSRVVSVASDAHRMVSGIDFEDPEWKRKKYQSFRVYGHSKLANILFARELARRLAGTGVTSNALHPGFVSTRFGESGTGFSRYLWDAAMYLAISPQEGARTPVYLASSPEVEGETGEYYYKCKVAKTTPAGRDAAMAERLWELSEGMLRRG